MTRRMTYKHSLTMSCGLLLILLTGGCARSTMKATPLWDSVYDIAEGPAEDRINAWPLLYYRKPALSILWPLITATDDSQAFVPLYEYHRDPYELRIGTLHPQAPSLALMRNGYWRFVILGHDTGNNLVFIFPIYFQNLEEKWLLIAPLFYKKDSEFWTPLITRTKNLKGFLGPLFFKYQDGEDNYYAFPAPIAGYSRGPDLFGFHLTPLVSYLRDGTNSWLVTLPYLSIKDETHITTLLLLIGYMRFKNPEGDFMSILWPIYTQYKSEERERRTLFPLYSYRKNQEGIEKSRFLFFLYDSLKIPQEGDKFYQRQRVLLRLFHRETDGTNTYTDLFPFITLDKGEDFRKVSFLGGLLGYHRNAGEKTLRLLYIPIKL